MQNVCLLRIRKININRISSSKYYYFANHIFNSIHFI